MQTLKTLKPHVSLNVRNVETSIEFYEKLFGIKPAKIRAGYAKFDVQNPPLNLALNESAQTQRGALSHLGIQVASTEDVLAAKSRWEQIGLAARDEMQTNCCYALQDKVWTRDPDGNEWEVFVVLEDNLPETSMCCAASGDAETNEAANSATACCTSETIAVSINQTIEKSCC